MSSAHPPFPAWRQTLGYGSVLVGLLVLVLGLLWLANAVLTPGSPAVFTVRTCIVAISAGGLLLFFGVLLVWPRDPKKGRLSS